MSTQPSEAAGDALVLALTEVIKGAASPEIQQAQALLLRRLATQGDVIPSRIPAPRNITEVGGYLNLLETLGENGMRREMLGSTLGLAGSAGVDPSLGGTVPPMRFTALLNEPGVGGPAVPLSVGVRSDLAGPLQAAIADVRAVGGHLPLWAPASALPAAGSGSAAPPDPMPFLGRAVWVAPTAATLDPATDPIVLGRAAGDPSPGFRVGIRVADGTAGAPKVDWTGLAWDAFGGGFVEGSLGQVSLLPIESALAASGFAAAPHGPAPTGRGDYGWARLVCIAGLVPGGSRLGEELALLWSADQIAQSAYAGHAAAVWDGTAFRG